MDPRVAVCLVSLAIACDVERDLSAQRFACQFGGACENSDGGIADSGVPIDPAPACDPAFGASEGPSVCGGDPVGEYTAASACSSRYLLEQFLDCPGARKNGQTFNIDGSLTVRSADLTARCTLDYEERAFVSNLCATAAGGCTGLRTVLLAQGAASATCEAATGGGCDCTVQAVYNCIETGAYTQSDSTVTVNGATRYEICRGESSLIYTTTDLDANDRRVVFVMSKVH